MNRDRAFSGLILIAAAIYGAIWYYRRKNAFQGTTITSPIAGKVALGAGTPLQALEGFAKEEGLLVTSTIGGQHNKGSLHYAGRAIDVRTRGMTDSQVQQVIQDARDAGLTARDEREHPAGQAVWSGPHLHLEMPY